ncbi:hypothetical protein MRS44_004189 [Fusarium solani]|uniref:uncharacterized protein n=1 Tax=Fusarium solani TaxID=169388 RepID=UPI0032C45554|nr:hypothetical protein MRS44_004189 [Fusarium solani]
MADEFGNPDRKSSLIEPLTTVWTIPDDCPSSVPLVGDEHTTLDSCCPPDYWTIWESFGFYSPGICPHGYTSGCTVTDSAYGGTVRPTEAAAICVPSSYSCSDYLIYASSVSGNDTIMVPAFQIRWAKSDLTAFETSTSTTSAATSTSSSSPTSHPHPTGLPTGAVVGIALGSAAVAVLAGFLFFFCFAEGGAVEHKRVMSHLMKTTRKMDLQSWRRQPNLQNWRQRQRPRRREEGLFANWNKKKNPSSQSWGGW